MEVWQCNKCYFKQNFQNIQNCLQCGKKRNDFIQDGKEKEEKNGIDLNSLNQKNDLKKKTILKNKGDWKKNQEKTIDEKEVWKCNKCPFNKNFMFKKECYKCGEKRNDSNQDEKDQKDNSRKNKERFDEKEVWKCNKCYFNKNFMFKKECHKCGEKRNESNQDEEEKNDNSRKNKERFDEKEVWKCNKCNFNKNFMFKKECHKCGEKRNESNYQDKKEQKDDKNGGKKKNFQKK
jgi:hypothetical protein